MTLCWVHVQVAEMSGHTSRVLHLAQSPDGVTVCSAAADETLRFWKCFAEAAPAKVRARPCSIAQYMCSMHRPTYDALPRNSQTAEGLSVGLFLVLCAGPPVSARLL